MVFKEIIWKDKRRKMYKVGQWVYGIKILEDENDLELCGYIYIGKCGDYIICAREYSDYLEDFKSQLNAMYKECFNDYFGVKVQLLKKELTFGNYEEAEDEFRRLVETLNNESDDDFDD